MKTNLFVLCAAPGLCACLHAAEPAPPAAPSAAPLAIFYSFDSAPPRTLLSAMESELARILAPARLRVAWRPLDHRSPAPESFAEVVVIRFRGACLFEPAASAGSPDTPGLPRAATDIVDGQILPFGEVDCNRLRSFIAPLTTLLNEDRANAALGKAMARVGAHELFHMLTRSPFHAPNGIARAQHSRSDLMSPSFTFAPPEVQWLRTHVPRSGAAIP